MSNEAHEAGCASTWWITQTHTMFDDSRCNCMLGEVRRLRAELSTAVEAEKWASETVHKMETENGRLRARVEELERNPTYAIRQKQAERIEELERDLKACTMSHVKRNGELVEMESRIDASEALLKRTIPLLHSDGSGGWPVFEQEIREYFRNKEKQDDD